jgi:DNA transformation protein
MPTRNETVAYIIEQAGVVADVTARKMFGEYALYADGKVVG